MEGTIQRVDIPQTVRVRKYPVDTNSLCECLRERKSASNFSNKELADLLNVPQTKVDHWFRQDDSFAIPDAEIWFKLKWVLGITTSEFDESIMTFEEREGTYEKSERCYLTDGISPTLTSASAAEKIIEPFIVASRGRNPDNPSDRTAGVHTEQRLEPNFSGCANTLTTVQKDNYVCEPQVLRAERTEYGKAIRKQYEAGEIDEKIGNMREMKPRTDGVTNTLTTVQKDNLVAEPVNADIKPTLVGGIGEKNFGGQYRQGNRVYDAGSIAVALMSNPVGNAGGNSSLYQHNYRIRKLTPKECWRLMGFDDADFEKAEQVCSNTQLYKQAGNSIVVNVLEAIFGNLLLAN